MPSEEFKGGRIESSEWRDFCHLVDEGKMDSFIIEAKKEEYMARLREAEELDRKRFSEPTTVDDLIEAAGRNDDIKVINDKTLPEKLRKEARYRHTLSTLQHARNIPLMFKVDEAIGEELRAWYKRQTRCFEDYLQRKHSSDS